jgi:hypothetical protein
MQIQGSQRPAISSKRSGTEVRPARPGQSRVGRRGPARTEAARFQWEPNPGIWQALSNARCHEALQRIRAHGASCPHEQPEGADAGPYLNRQKSGSRLSSPTERVLGRTSVVISRATGTRCRQRQAAGIQFSESSSPTARPTYRRSAAAARETRRQQWRRASPWYSTTTGDDRDCAGHEDARPFVCNGLLGGAL